MGVCFKRVGGRPWKLKLSSRRGAVAISASLTDLDFLWFWSFREDQKDVQNQSKNHCFFSGNLEVILGPFLWAPGPPRDTQKGSGNRYWIWTVFSLFFYCFLRPLLATKRRPKINFFMTSSTWPPQGSPGMGQSRQMNPQEYQNDTLNVTKMTPKWHQNCPKTM